MSGSVTTDDRRQAYARALSEAGVRLTHQRLEICAELAGRADHPTAEAIYRALHERLPTLSQDTVYRTLWLLHDLGLVGTLSPRGEGVRFDANSTEHHHFHCQRCGRVMDFEASTPQAPVAATALGEVKSLRLDVRGVCRDCLTDAGADRAP